MDIKSTIIIMPTDEPQHFYKNIEGNFYYRPDLIKKSLEDNVFPQHMHSISRQTPKPGEWYFDSIDDEIYKCDRIEDEIIYTKDDAIGQYVGHAFKIIGSTDKNLNVLSINSDYLNLFCDTKGEIRDNYFKIPLEPRKTKVIKKYHIDKEFLKKAMTAAGEHGKSIGVYLNSGLSKKYEPVSLAVFINTWIAKHL